MRDLFSTLFLAFVFLTPVTQAQNLKKEWAFVHNEDGRIRQFKQGQSISVKWGGLSGVKTTKGSLADITTDSLTLSLGDYVGSIAKKDVEEITTKKSGLGLKLLSALIVLAGIFITGFFILIQLVYNMRRTDRQLATREYKTYWPWALIGLGVIALGFVRLRSPHQRTAQSFGKSWSMKEISAITNKIP
ncbi:MAG: hypothetical protein H7246_00345 [Phycisphaerae bacterium]|nr:hypothetical protein [Saprospiraceae bacterium]